MKLGNFSTFLTFTIIAMIAMISTISLIQCTTTHIQSTLTVGTSTNAKSKTKTRTFMTLTEEILATLYKKNDEDKNMGKRHSLSEGRDSLERISNTVTGLPAADHMSLDEKSKKAAAIKDPERLLSMRIVDKYQQMFDYMDYEPVDDLISANELKNVYDNFLWPKIFKAEGDYNYCKKVIATYDKTGKQKINFVEFTHYMEDLWSSQNQDKEEEKKHAFLQAKDQLSKLFNWLDRDSDKSVTVPDMIFGISRIMLNDANVKEIKNVYNIYDPEKTGKLNEEKFLLAIVNGHFDKTFQDDMISDNFLTPIKPEKENEKSKFQ